MDDKILVDVCIISIFLNSVTLEGLIRIDL